jgi:hypothetical protein
MCWEKAVKLLAQLVQPGLVGQNKNKDQRESRWEGKAVLVDVFKKVTGCTVQYSNLFEDIPTFFP